MNGNAAIVSYSVQVSNIFFRYDVTTALSTGGFGCGFNTGDYNTGIITTQNKSKRDGRKRRGLNESFLHFHYVFFSIKIQILPWCWTPPFFLQTWWFLILRTTNWRIASRMVPLIHPLTLHLISCNLSKYLFTYLRNNLHIFMIPPLPYWLFFLFWLFNLITDRSAHQIAEVSTQQAMLERLQLTLQSTSRTRT